MPASDGTPPQAKRPGTIYCRVQLWVKSKTAPLVLSPSSLPWREVEGDFVMSSVRYVLFSFDGRIGPVDYWLKGVLPIALCGLPIYIPLTILLSNGGSAAALAVLGMIPFSIVMLWVGFALAIKRWHDLGHPGWLVLIQYGFPVLSYWYLGNLAVLVGVGMWVVVAFIPGNAEPNQYGYPMGHPLRGKRRPPVTSV